MTERAGRVVISVRDVSVSYRKGRSLFSSEAVEVYKNLSFDLCEGDSLGVVGRNGAGKSTLLKLLSGVIAPDRGEIVFNCSKVALLALGAGFNPQLTGRRNILMNGLLLGFKRSEILSKTDEIIEYSGVGAAINDPLKTYSAGMRARLAFAIAIHMQPEVLLIDEALGVGDAAFMQKSTQAIHERVCSSQTVVLVSHQADTVKRLCNKAIWIEEGVLRMAGAAAEVVQAYEAYITGLRTKK
jgi:lipopolysaccharide transport system ATP-binding protein